MYEECHLFFISKTIKYKGNIHLHESVICFMTLLGTIFTPLKVYRVSLICTEFNINQYIKPVLLFFTKYMVMSLDQNAGQSHSMKIDNSSLVEEFK